MEKQDLNHNDWDGCTEIVMGDKLLQSVRDGNSVGVKYLLEQGEDPSACDEVRYAKILFSDRGSVILMIGLCKSSYWSRPVTLLFTWPWWAATTTSP